MKKILFALLYIILTAVLGFISFLLSELWITRTWIFALIIAVLCVIIAKNTKIKFRVFMPLILVMFLVPDDYLIKDGGSRLYETPFYSVHIYHGMLTDANGSLNGWLKGAEVKIFGITVYENVYKEYFSE